MNVYFSQKNECNFKFAKVQKMPFTEYSFFDEMQLCVLNTVFILYENVYFCNLL